jgi:hypothetical protein
MTIVLEVKGNNNDLIYDECSTKFFAGKKHPGE